MLEQDLNDPRLFDEMEEDKKQILLDWVKEHFQPTKNTYHYKSSYGLKHIFEATEVGFYICNGEFKGAMRAAGFEPEYEHAMNWDFKISRRSKAFKLKVHPC